MPFSDRDLYEYDPNDNEYDDLDDEYGADEYEEKMQNCGMTHDGSCTMAGSEDCDIECPFREEADRRLAATRAKARSEAPAAFRG